MLNFRCTHCQHEIQADYQFIGELVQCPLCETVQVVPDPLLPSGSNFHGYKIEQVRANSLLWTTYQAVGQKMNTGQTVLIRIPTRFFLKRVTDFNAFVETVIKGGSLNMPEFPHLVDRSVVSGKVYFVFEYMLDAQNLTRFTNPESLLEPELTLLVVRNIATALRTAWDKEGMVHQNLIPHNLRLRNNWGVRITNMGLSQFLIADQSLLQHGFNIWDYHYMSQEFLVEGVADTPAVDIYALGGILYLLNTGHDPYEDVPPGDIAAAPLPDVRKYNPQVPEQLALLIQKLMAKDLADRPQGWDEAIGRIDKTLHLGTANLSVTDVIRQSVTAGAQTGAFDPTGLSAGGFSAPPSRRTKNLVGTDPKMAQQKPTETVAKLAPAHLQEISTLNRDWRRRHGAARPKGVHREDEAKRTILGAMALVTLVVLCALGAFLYFQDQHRMTEQRRMAAFLQPDPEPDKPAVTEAAPAVTTVPAPTTEVTPPPKTTTSTPPTAPPAASPLNNRIAAVEAFAQENPSAYGEILRRYDEVLRESIRLGRRETVDRLHEQIAVVEKSRDVRVHSVLEALEARVKELVAIGDYAGAVRLLRDYDSEYAEETRTGRIRLALKYEQEAQEKGSLTVAAAPPPPTTTPSPLAESFVAQVPAMLAGEVLEAELQLKLATTLPENQEVKPFYENLIRQLAEYRDLKAKLADPKVTVASLNLKPEDSLLLGLVHFTKGDVAAAREAFGKLPKFLADPLLAEMTRNEPSTAFQALLRNAGFTLDPKHPEALLLELTKKQLTPADAGKLAEALTAFSATYGKSDFYQENANVVKELSQYCERILGSKVETTNSKVVNVTPKSSGGLRQALETAESGTEFVLAPGLYYIPRLELALNDITITGGPGVQMEGVLVIAANNVEIRQITITKGQLLVGSGSHKTTLRQCRFEDLETRITEAASLLAENCLFHGLQVKDGNDLVFRHCTFLSPKRGVEAAVCVNASTGTLEIADSILFGNTYGILFSSEAGSRDRVVHHSLWHATSGLAALQEKADSVIATRTVVDRGTRLRRYCRTKNNLYVRPQFINSTTGDWRLVPGVPGTGKASDGKDMGVIAGP